MSGADTSRNYIDGPIHELAPEVYLSAAQTLAGIAAEDCTCTDKKHTSCGLSNALDALSLREVVREIRTS